MTLEEKINGELKTAMLAKDEASVRGLRAIKQSILMAKTSGATTVSTEDEIKMLQKLVKQRKESVEIYQQQNRPDLAKPELEEIAVIEKFLPQQMGESEIRSELTRIIGEVGAKSPQDMGKVMGAASKFFAGKADNKIVSQLVKELLS
ncbi:MAG: GatB/YqeY domain-containing protein [Bacteroidetes bacterium]|nr:GatB/YqeY domain-containing protein [Bacteroidota bacterium]MBK6838207.1 GatB/YqeY domain-containing protein [Bacteroidota bacterium]MBK9543925.1 GatB/YqeY domain-containing protein [Bacteroidota bacterium]